MLPKKICQNCYDKLIDMLNFHQQIFKAFKIYKDFAEYQNTLALNTQIVEQLKVEPFDYEDEDFISDDLRQFFRDVGTGKIVLDVNPIPNAKVTIPNANPKVILKAIPNVNPKVTPKSIPNEPFLSKIINKVEARKPKVVAEKRKRGRPKKYCGLMQFKNDDLTDVEKMKDAVVNSVPNIDGSQTFFEEPMMVTIRKKRGRPKNPVKQEKENEIGANETYIITDHPKEADQSNETIVLDETIKSKESDDPDAPGCSVRQMKGNNKKVTRIGAIQSDVDPHEYTYQLPYDPKATITFISNTTDKFFFCKTCNKQYCDFSSLRKHFVHHSSIKIFQCNICHYQTFTKHCLDTHQIVHADARPETCQECGKTFKSKDRLHRHSYCHMKRFICDICGKEFSHSAMLKKHVQHIHINERNFLCPICDFAAKSKEYLNRHMLRHDNSDENKIECTVCKKLLKTRNSFKIHMKRHEDDRKFQCSLCDKKYVVKSQLDIHFRIHTGFKPFACRFCGKQFRKADPFKNHVRIHTNEKPFVCHYCNKKFTQKVSLQVHLRLHTGERPYRCDECGKTFIQGSVYKLHLKRYHPVVVHSEALT